MHPELPILDLVVLAGAIWLVIVVPVLLSLASPPRTHPVTTRPSDPAVWVDDTLRTIFPDGVDR